MAKPRDIIPTTPTDVRKLPGIEQVNLLFFNFVEYGIVTGKWRYDSIGGSDGAEGQVSAKTILDGTNNGVVYCEPLVYAFMDLVQAVGAGGGLNVKQVTHGQCLLQPGYKCIDPNVVGNVRMPNGTYAERAQCFFSAKHVYCSVGPVFYDPCFATRYHRAGEPILSEGFTEASGYKYPTIGGWVASNDDPLNILLRKVDSESPPGFKCGYVLEDPKKLTGEVKKQVKTFFKDQENGTFAEAFKKASKQL